MKKTTVVKIKIYGSKGLLKETLTFKTSAKPSDLEKLACLAQELYEDCKSSNFLIKARNADFSETSEVLVTNQLKRNLLFCKN